MKLNLIPWVYLENRNFDRSCPSMYLNLFSRKSCCLAGPGWLLFKYQTTFFSNCIFLYIKIKLVAIINLIKIDNIVLLWKSTLQSSIRIVNEPCHWCKPGLETARAKQRSKNLGSHRQKFHWSSINYFKQIKTN